MGNQIIRLFGCANKMIKINSIEYESYYDMCKALNISYADFINYRRLHKDIDELSLLGHFIDNIACSLSTGEYATFERKSK